MDTDASSDNKTNDPEMGGDSLTNSIHNKEIETPTQATQEIIQPLKIYIKTSSFDQPNSSNSWDKTTEPMVKISLSSFWEKVSQDIYEVWIKSTITSAIENKVQYVIEIEQAGLFTIKGILPAQQMQRALSITCPTVLYPYLRYNMSDAIMRGGFKPVNLSEVNFNDLYERKLARTSHAFNN